MSKGPLIFSIASFCSLLSKPDHSSGSGLIYHTLGTKLQQLRLLHPLFFAEFLTSSRLSLIKEATSPSLNGHIFLFIGSK